MCHTHLYLINVDIRSMPPWCRYKVVSAEMVQVVLQPDHLIQPHHITILLLLAKHKRGHRTTSTGQRLFFPLLCSPEADLGWCGAVVLDAMWSNVENKNKKTISESNSN